MKERGSALIIIIGIILMLFVLGFFRSEPSFFGTFNYKKALRLPCGITVRDLEPEEKILFPFELRGYVNGCGWEVQNGTGGMAQAFDSKGFAVTYPTPLVVPSSETSDPYAFTADMKVLNSPQTSEGNIIITSTTGLVHAIPVLF